MPGQVQPGQGPDLLQPVAERLVVDEQPLGRGPLRAFGLEERAQRGQQGAVVVQQRLAGAGDATWIDAAFRAGDRAAGGGAVCAGLPAVRVEAQEVRPAALTLGQAVLAAGSS